VDGCFFWYRLTRVDPDKGPYNGRVCVMLPTYINGYFHQLTRTLFWIYLMYLGLSNSNSQTTTQDGLTQPKGLKHPASIHRYVCFGMLKLWGACKCKCPGMATKALSSVRATGPLMYEGSPCQFPLLRAHTGAVTDDDLTCLIFLHINCVCSRIHFRSKLVY